MMEVWKVIDSHPDYSVSSYGRVKRTTPNRYGIMSNKPLVPVRGNHGYFGVNLHCETRQTVKLVHSLVCEAFHGKRPSKKHQAAHSDGDRSNNKAANISWKTASQNSMDKHRHGTMRTGKKHHAIYMPECMPRGELHGNAKLTDQLVKNIRRDKRPQSVIAAEIGVTQSLISMVKTRKIWNHI